MWLPTDTDLEHSDKFTRLETSGGRHQYFHFDTIPSNLGISIDAIEYDTDTCNVHVRNAFG